MTIKTLEGPLEKIIHPIDDINDYSEEPIYNLIFHYTFIEKLNGNIILNSGKFLPIKFDGRVVSKSTELDEDEANNSLRHTLANLIFSTKLCEVNESFFSCSNGLVYRQKIPSENSKLYGRLEDKITEKNPLIFYQLPEEDDPKNHFIGLDAVFDWNNFLQNNKVDIDKRVCDLRKTNKESNMIEINLFIREQPYQYLNEYGQPL